MKLADHIREELITRKNYLLDNIILNEEWLLDPTRVYSAYDCIMYTARYKDEIAVIDELLASDKFPGAPDPNY